MNKNRALMHDGTKGQSWIIYYEEGKSSNGISSLRNSIKNFCTLQIAPYYRYASKVWLPKVNFIKVMDRVHEK